MPLEFIDHGRESANKFSWMPSFDRSVAYENERCWDEPGYYSVSEPWFVQVLEDSVEIARVEFDDPGGINPKYVGVPKLGSERLKIQFIDVAAAATRRGIGTRVVQGLADMHHWRRLVAYSGKADEFWASLGRQRFDHSDGMFSSSPGADWRRSGCSWGPFA